MLYPEEIIVKPAKTFEEQCEKLKDYNCIVNDKDFCIKKLKQLNYYRLSGYFLPYKISDNEYYPVEFETIVDIYDFDTELRNWCILTLEEIEIFIRTQIAYHHATEYEPLAYLKKECFSDQEKYIGKINDLQKKFDDAIKFHAKDDVIEHHLERYEGQFPIWVLVDYLKFTTLSIFFKCLKNSDKIKIIKRFPNPKMRYEEVESHLHCLSVLRNSCAHYERLYYKIFSPIPKGVPETAGKRIFSRILAMKNIYPDITKWNDELVPKLEQIINKYIKSINLEHIGFPQNEWQQAIRIQ